MKVADLFCGMGGLSYGFFLEGFKIVGFDKSRYAVSSFNYNRLGVAFRKNLLNSKIKLERNCEIIIGGPPCEPWSRLNLNKKKRLSKHPLHRCLSRFFNIIAQKEPIVFIMENVPDVLRDPKVNTILRRLKTRYSIAARVIRYSDYGAAISRRRLFIIGVRNDWKVEADEVFDKMPLGSPKSVKEAIWDLRNRDWDPTIDHIWPRVKTISKYLNYYALGKYGWYVLSWNKPSPSFGNITKTYVLHPDSFDGGEARPISVREALSIMGFPDEYRFPENIPLVAKYEMIADAVSPVFSKKLARAIKKLF